MIPSAEEVIAGFPFVARRFGMPGRLSEALVREGVDEARSLATGRTFDEPAALFFAFARRPGAFERGWRVMPRILAAAHAAALGFRIDADARSIDGLCADVAFGMGTSYDEIRAWFQARLKASK